MKLEEHAPAPAAVPCRPGQAGREHLLSSTTGVGWGWSVDCDPQMGMLNVFTAMKNENGLGRLVSLLSFVVLMESCKGHSRA